MALGLIAAALIAFFSMFVPGVLLAFALLKNSELDTFETVVIGFIFGLIAPASLTWAESYLMNYIHAFAFSTQLFLANAVVLTVLGAALCYWQGAFKDLRAFISSRSGMLRAGVTGSRLGQIRHGLKRFSRGREMISAHEAEDSALRSRQDAELREISTLSDAEKDRVSDSHKAALERLRESHVSEESGLLRELDGKGPETRATAFKPSWVVWAILLALMLLTFYTRMQSTVIAPKFFEFDPYFDMIDAHYILTYGKQLLLDPSAWPVVAAGTNHRLQPIVPYLEAFWYNLANGLKFHHAQFSTSLMSYVGGIYPPITAALLVFVIFMLLYHEYDERIGLIGAGLTATMPVLFTTFIAGEQLVEPWGLFALFFFFATYMLAVRNMKDKRLAILAGIAFASNFLGAHYYTVTMGVLSAYILAEGIIDIFRNEPLDDFYKMNAIVLGTIILLYALYAPYQATLQSNLSSVFGIPIMIAGPLFSLIFIAILDQLPRQLAKRKLLIKEYGAVAKAAFMAALFMLILMLILFTRVGNSLRSFINLSARFTTPSKPLFMTVQEYIPTGILYNFGAQGFGAIGAGLYTVPWLVLLVCFTAIVLIAISIIFRKSKTGVFYLAIALPLMFAGFSEVKYLPHLGTAYIMLFCIIIGEVLYIASAGFNLTGKDMTKRFNRDVYLQHPLAAQGMLIIGLFFLFGIAFAVLAIIYILVYRYGIHKNGEMYNAWLIIICIALIFLSFTNSMLIYGEGISVVQSIGAQLTYSSKGTNACSIMSNRGNSLGYNIYCNTIPQYWLNAMSWINGNVGPNAPRVLAWWDYGDWINWFGNSNAVLRGDNSVAAEDYSVAAQYVLGSRQYNYTPQRLAQYMNSNQTKYVLFDQDLISKWGALNFLACVNINATSEHYAIAQGAASTPPVPYVLGTSQCELQHDPEFVLLPLSALIPSNQTLGQQSISDYCPISKSTTTFISGYLVIGSNLENKTVCVNAVPNSNGVLNAYSTNGTKLNAVVQSSAYLGVQNIQGSYYVEFLMIYLPNGPNGTITNAPSDFYDSNYYKGFFLGNLPGFKLVYPSNSTGINMVNGTYPVRIYELPNYTGTLPTIPAKPSWVHNNYTMP